MESRRLSLPSWRASHRDGLPACRQSPIAVLNRARRRVTSFQLKRVTNYATPPTTLLT